MEINNAASSYTNGELNPDRKQQQAAPDSPNNVEAKVQVENVRSQQSTPPPKQQKVEKAGDETAERKSQGSPEPQQQEPSNSDAAAAAGEARRAAFGNKMISIDGGCSEKLIHLLDETERRVEQLRYVSIMKFLQIQYSGMRSHKI